MGLHQLLMICLGTCRPGLLSPLKGNDLVGGRRARDGVGISERQSWPRLESASPAPQPNPSSIRWGSRGWLPSHGALTPLQPQKLVGFTRVNTLHLPASPDCLPPGPGRLQTVQGGEAEAEVEVTMKGQYPPMDPFLQPPSFPSFHFFFFFFFCQKEFN